MTAITLPVTDRQCERCGVALVRRRDPSGMAEALSKFARRRFCSVLCGNRRGPKPPPMTFTRGYQAALATGVDLLELRDACWED